MQGIQIKPDIRMRLFSHTTSVLGQIATRASMQLQQFLSRDLTIYKHKEFLSGLKQVMPPALLQQKDDESDLKLRQIITQSNEVLARATTVFPLTMFRDNIVVDRTKITITKRSFFMMSEVMSIRIEDVLNVKAIVGPFFGSIILAVRVLSTEDHHSINYFWRHDAVHLKHIIQGYVIAQHNKIKCAHLPKDKLIDTLTELGHDSNG